MDAFADLYAVVTACPGVRAEIHHRDDGRYECRMSYAGVRTVEAVADTLAAAVEDCLVTVELSPGWPSLPQP